MQLLKYFQAMLSRTILPFSVILAMACPAQAQIKPGLDSNILPYQPVGSFSGTIAIAGSDSMKPLTESWANDLRQLYPGLTIKVSSAGSETGLAQLMEGKAQVAAISRRMTVQEIVEFKREFGYEPTEVPVAVDALAVFVHKDNPIEGLTLAQVDAIFSIERRRGLRYPVNSWGDAMLLEEGWVEAPIHIYGRNGNSGTATFFREHVLNGADFKKTMTVGAGSASVVVELMKDRYGIGFSGIGYRTSGLRPVPLATVQGGRYVAPTFETAMDGSYPLRRQLYLYVNRAPKVALPGSLAEYVKFALSQQGQQIVVDEGYYALQTMELTRLIAMWSTPVRTAAGEQPIKLRD
ncbi:MAG: PstS family phosphate ABC transporter substrate-binding protein [Nitrospirota bacterium]|nr:PstS family phosphate ABC transporter substrate-binding protein [Nitrospirota bacterium]